MSNQFFFIIVTLVEMTNQLIVIIVTLFEMTIPLKIATLLEMTNLLNVSPFTCYLKWLAQTLCYSCYLLLEVANPFDVSPDFVQALFRMLCIALHL